MSDLPPEPREEETDLTPPPELMPRWVPVAIGVILVTLATLAVVTGLRYREQTLVKIVKPSRPIHRTTGPAPPGEPEPGASLVLSGDGGSNVPVAREPMTGATRAEVTGGRGGVVGIMRIWARRGMKIIVTPNDAIVYVNDVPVGQARQFDSEDEIYDFAAPGSYTVKLVAPGYKDRQFVVTASETAPADVAEIKARLEKQ